MLPSVIAPPSAEVERADRRMLRGSSEMMARKAGSGGLPVPKVSVIIPTYNGAGLIGQSIASILSQTFADFELIVVDDGSIDDTAAILAAYRDPRMRVMRNESNLGVVGARNRAFAEARGTYVALLDHDDLAYPTRLAKQVAHLDAHPNTVVLGTKARTLRFGQLLPPGRASEPTDAFLLDWMLHLVNPLIQSSVMLRADAVRRLGTFMREEFTYADDFDLYHRMLPLGDIERLDECLTIYRLHGRNASLRFEAAMIVNAAKVFEAALRPWFGDEAAAAAALIANLVSARKPAPDVATLDRLGHYLEWLLDAFLRDRNPPPEAAAAIGRHAGLVWWQAVRQTAFSGCPGALFTHRRHARLVEYFHPPLRERLFSVAKALYSTVPFLRAFKVSHRPEERACVPAVAVERLFNRAALPARLDLDRPPTLFVVVDTESEFDWNKPLGRDQTGVTNIAAQATAQSIFDRYGLRPVYVIDYPVASQSEGYGPLCGFLKRDSCEIGVHLHPWTTPPFDEVVSDWNSYPGNLSADLEERKLVNLIDVIRRNLGVEPLFYKAGRHGLGPNTIDLLARRGLMVDLSVLPATNRTAMGGPDSRWFEPTPYWIDGTNILAAPITRSFIGPFMPWKRWLGPVLQSPLGRTLRMSGILARLRLFDFITLTPEGIDAAKQVALIKALLGRGHHIFMMHYHSPSLVAGHTPYVRTEADVADFLQRIDTVCRFFFETLGGLPGHPRDLLPPRLRYRHSLDLLDPGRTMENISSIV